MRAVPLLCAQLYNLQLFVVVVNCFAKQTSATAATATTVAATRGEAAAAVAAMETASVFNYHKKKLLLLQFCANLERLQLYKSTMQTYICIYKCYSYIYIHTYIYIHIYTYVYPLHIPLHAFNLSQISLLLLLFIFVLFNICLTFVAPFSSHPFPFPPCLLPDLLLVIIVFSLLLLPLNS